MTADLPVAPSWMSALRPYVESDDLRVELKTPVTLPTGKLVLDPRR